MEKKKLLIRDVTTTCEGIATSSDGVVFVDKTLPQEEVNVKITDKKKNYSKGVLLDIIKPSEHRVKPPCKYFGLCGGCGLQHADINLQYAIKKKRVHDALCRIGKVNDPIVEECVGTDEKYGYRNKITIPLLEVNGRKRIGFFKKRSHEIVSIESCLLHVEMADNIYHEVRNILLDSDLKFYSEKKKSGDLQHLVIRSSRFEDKVLIGIIGLCKPSKELKNIAKQIASINSVKGVVYGIKAKATNSIYPEVLEVLEGDSELVEDILGVKVKISLLSFFQVNKSCAEMLYRKAFEFSGAVMGDKVLDAYSGIGSFAIYLAKKGLRVTGIESFKEAVEDAKQNAIINDTDVHFIEGKVEEKVQELSGFDCVFINPPRKGVHGDVIDALIKMSPKKIVYTSCDPGTLARDIALLGLKGYKLKMAAPFDMFPQTIHVETVALLYKNDC